MKLIHLSDLHLGKRVNEVSMIEDQEYILHQIIRIIKDKNADAVLLSGDIYDKSVPSAEAVTLFDEFLSRLAQLKVQVFAITVCIRQHDGRNLTTINRRHMDACTFHQAITKGQSFRAVVIAADSKHLHLQLCQMA